MMEVSKIHLSLAEAELMQNAEIILTKNRVLQKIRLLLEELQEKQLHFLKEMNIEKTDAFFISPKISRGENYEGLPYLILDFPRNSNDGNLFFIRIMFWWGNFFSSTLHVSGNYKKEFLKNIKNSFPLLCNYYIGVNADPWHHHFENDNYKKIGEVSENDFDIICESGDHLKIASQISLSQWQQVPQILFENWKYLLSVCGLVTS